MSCCATPDSGEIGRTSRDDEGLPVVRVTTENAAGTMIADSVLRGGSRVFGATGGPALRRSWRVMTDCRLTLPSFILSHNVKTTLWHRNLVHNTLQIPYPISYSQNIFYNAYMRLK